jgi:CheB methylesterase
MADDDEASFGKEGGAESPAVRTREPVIVGIGASAGGIQVLQAMLGALPDNTGAAFVIIVHLDPEKRSELPSILATRTKMPVVQVGETTKLQANHVYVIPPDRGLQLIDHEISTREFAEPRGQRSPIDLFFRSLAEHLGDGCAVVLSGAGSDGAIGVRAVKEAGGIILVQDPAEAEYSSMPRSRDGGCRLHSARARPCAAAGRPGEDQAGRGRNKYSPYGRGGLEAGPRPFACSYRPRLLEIQTFNRPSANCAPHAGDPRQ